MAAIGQDKLRALVDHLFLPPKLPQTLDDTSEISIIRLTLRALQQAKLLGTRHEQQALDKLVAIVKDVLAIHDAGNGGIVEEALLKRLQNLQDGQTLAVKVSAQNAALMISRKAQDIIFESFELSAHNEAVMSTKGRLIRTFPGQAAAVRASLLTDSDFAPNLAATLAKMSIQAVKEMQEVSIKTGTAHAETRDTASPFLICGTLLGTLRGCGIPVTVSTIKKHTRDEILWKNTDMPWRRSPMWLLLKVCIQLTLSRTENSFELYKKVILAVLITTLEALDSDTIDQDLRFVMHAKIARRLYKLRQWPNITDNDQFLAKIETTLAYHADDLQKKWQTIQDLTSPRLDLEALKRLNFGQDIASTIPILDDYISRPANSKAEQAVKSFQPSGTALPPVRDVPYQRFSPDCLNNTPYAIARLREIELWVAEKAATWASGHHPDEVTRQMRMLLRDYHTLAKQHYFDDPEGLSEAVLCVFELWILCDKAAIATCPLLAEYGCGMPTHALTSLILPHRSQMLRLHEVEHYLKERQGTIAAGYLFSAIHDKSFSCRFFDQSPRHQALQRTILAWGHSQREKTKVKFAEMCALCKEYQAHILARPRCDFDDITVVLRSGSYTDKQHSASCERCLWQRKLKGLRIDVHEWPLPTDPYLSKTVVFELQVPAWYAEWRSMRQYILHDVQLGKHERISFGSKHTLSRHDRHLATWYEHSSSATRIGLLSKVKSTSRTHWGNKIAELADHNSLFVPNGLEYRYVDFELEAHVKCPSFGHSLADMCTYTVRSKVLQPYLRRPAPAPDGLSSNYIYANQDVLPPDMTLEEYRDSAHILSGLQLQWLNMATQLHMSTINLTSTNTATVFLQCINQTGPPGRDFRRQAHTRLDDSYIVSVVLESAREALHRIENNWNATLTVSIVVAIALRCASLGAAQGSALSLLGKARLLTLRWTQQIQSKLEQDLDEVARPVLENRLLKTALVCASTFDLDDEQLQILLDDPSSVSILVQSAIMIHDSAGSLKSKLQYVRLLHVRAARILQKAADLIVSNLPGLDAGIAAVWPAYGRGSPWKSYAAPYNHWMTCTTSQLAGGISHVVHFDLLLGRLLVDGVPANKPPAMYRKQALYGVLFGNRVIEAMPATRVGFDISLRRTFDDWIVQIGTDSRGTMIVQASSGGKELETIPQYLLGDTYPKHFRDDFVHWYDHELDLIYFRPSNKPWPANGDDCLTLTRTADRRGWQLVQADFVVLPVSSDTSICISAILSPLARPSNIHMTLNCQTAGLQIELPLVRHAFSLARCSNELRSREFPHMVVSEHQNAGTLFGLDNKLLLQEVRDDSKILLIPYGNVAYKRLHVNTQQAYTKVKISTIGEQALYAFKINTRLQAVVGPGDTRSQIYLAYLHALTAGCLPDSLLAKTGTEQALSMLSSAALMSFRRLSDEHVDLLKRIAELSPRRSFYPLHCTSMQSVEWSSEVGVQAQHELLLSRTNTILAIAQDLEVLYVDGRPVPAISRSDEYLHRRALRRNAMFRVDGFGAMPHRPSHDRTYISRERDWPRQAENAATISRSLSQDQPTVFFAPIQPDKIWSLLSKFDAVLGPHALIDIQFDGSLLDGLEAQRCLLERLPSFIQYVTKAQHRIEHKYAIMFFMSTMASAAAADMQLVETLALCTKLGSSSASLTGLDVARPSAGSCADQVMLLKQIESLVLEFRRCPEADLPCQLFESPADHAVRIRQAWFAASNHELRRLAAALTGQWPETTLLQPDDELIATYVDVPSAMVVAQNLFKLWHDNNLLREHCRTLEHMPATLRKTRLRLPQMQMRPTDFQLPSAKEYIARDDLFSMPPPSLPTGPPQLRESIAMETPGVTQTLRLRNVLDAMKHAESIYQQKYNDDLYARCKALERSNYQPLAIAIPDERTLTTYHISCKLRARQIYQSIVDALSSLQTTSALQAAQLLPRVSLSYILAQLCRRYWPTLSPAWQHCLMSLGVAINELQRAERMLKKARFPEALKAELSNHGHDNWEPVDHPEWLLMEIEGDIMIRSVQASVADLICNPVGGKNLVTQLNMGEGKSSTIIPMAISDLADGKQLLRVLVGRPQSKQMAQMLSSKLGGLIGRRIIIMPFSRSLQIDQRSAVTIRRMLEACRSSGSVLLVQPEHILSFKLMAPENALAGRIDTCAELLASRDLFNNSSRDLIDESDDNLSVRFELVYTHGRQQLIDGAPDRWSIIQQVLALTQTLIGEVRKHHTDGIELHDAQPGAFPQMRLLNRATAGCLTDLLAKQICRHGINGLELSRHPEAEAMIYAYIRKNEVPEAVTQGVIESPLWTCRTKATLLVLRGLLANGLIDFALSDKRWRVQYGLTTRDPPTRLAVPYTAKDRPSARSEFSHPDVAIVLTQLSYYYQGLSDKELIEAFEHLQASDQADDEYTIWTRHTTLSNAYKLLSNINLKDDLQCTQDVFPALRYQKTVINYFCSHLVFRKDSKDYTHRLAASGWDLAERKASPVTGFSGTIDSRLTLPLSIEHFDLPDQISTNARVLECLLLPDNEIAIMPPSEAGSQAVRILDRVLALEPQVQVILDVGAQILELDTLAFSKLWLYKHDISKEAVIFVDDADELRVVDRSGRIDNLALSAFATRTQACLVFLDQCHTRGIDLQLPQSYRAALTLGSKLNKDQLVQASMRMRQLGKGQTLTFIVPSEIEKVIIAGMGCTPRPIQLDDIVLWAISETHADAARTIPLWRSQGQRYLKHQAVWARCKHNGRTELNAKKAEALLEADSMTLEQRYHPSRQQIPIEYEHSAQLKEIEMRCRQFDGMHSYKSTFSEEQERELSTEIERERERHIERPAKVKLKAHNLHWHVEHFAKTGLLLHNSEAYMPAFRSLSQTSAARTSTASSYLGTSKLMVTTDFAQTVDYEKSTHDGDHFQRSVQWVLTSTEGKGDVVSIILIISPYEANLLISTLSPSSKSTLHIFKPRVNTAYDTMDQLDFFVWPQRSTPAQVPRALAMELALFSGQLYISSYEDYEHVCNILGLWPTATTLQMRREGWIIDANGFILTRPGHSNLPRLPVSPVEFMQQFLSRVRRFGDNIDKTQLGQILQGHRLFPNEFRIRRGH